LVQNGVPAGNIKTISYGKEKPFCNESNEACWQQNRRAHFVLTK
jgi:peptidoglycan-associated lipoprotein